MKNVICLFMVVLFVVSCGGGSNSSSTKSSKGLEEVLTELRGREGVSDIQALLDENGVNAQGPNLQTPLMLASGYGYINLVNALIKDNAYVNAANLQGTTSLMLASANGFADITDALIKNNAYVDIKNNNKATSLYTAALNNKADVVGVLLKAKSTVPKAFDDKEFLTNMNVNKDIQDMLAEAPKAESIKLSSNLEKVLTELRGREGVSDIQNLLDEGGINAQGIDNVTPLMQASVHGYINLVNALIKDGAYINATYSDNNFAGGTALMLAAIGGFSDICKSLIDNGAYINQVISDDGYKATPLLFAVVEKKSDVVALLIEEKASDIGFDQFDESDIEEIDSGIKSMLVEAGYIKEEKKEEKSEEKK